MSSSAIIDLMISTISEQIPTTCLDNCCADDDITRAIWYFNYDVFKKKPQDICEAMHTNDMPALMWISKISKINIQKGVDIEFVQK